MPQDSVVEIVSATAFLIEESSERSGPSQGRWIDAERKFERAAAASVR